MENLKEIILEILEYKKSLGLKDLTSDMILDCSTRIFNNQSIQQSKRENIQEFREQDSKMTLKQRNWLMKNQIDFDPGWSKEEAKQVIKQAIESQRGSKNEY